MSAQSASKSGAVFLSQLEPSHMELLEKIILLPHSQQVHLTTIIDGLGTGKDKQQRLAAKNTVMTILGITPQDYQFIKQFKKLASYQQDDLRKLVVDQLSPQMATEVGENITSEQETPEREVVEPIQTVSRIETAQPKIKVETPLKVEEVVKPAPVTIAAPKITESNTPPTAKESHTSQSASKATKTKATPKVAAKNSSMERSVNIVKISALGTGLVCSSAQPIENFETALFDNLGLKFRSVFGLFKSVDKKALSLLNKDRIDILRSEGFMYDGISYPVEFEGII